jgi:hypothetical protein
VSRWHFRIGKPRLVLQPWPHVGGGLIGTDCVLPHRLKRVATGILVRMGSAISAFAKSAVAQSPIPERLRFCRSRLVRDGAVKMLDSLAQHGPYPSQCRVDCRSSRMQRWRTLGPRSGGRVGTASHGALRWVAIFRGDIGLSAPLRRSARKGHGKCHVPWIPQLERPESAPGQRSGKAPRSQAAGQARCRVRRCRGCRHTHPLGARLGDGNLRRQVGSRTAASGRLGNLGPKAWPRTFKDRSRTAQILTAERLGSTAMRRPSAGRFPRLDGDTSSLRAISF